MMMGIIIMVMMVIREALKKVDINININIKGEGGLACY